VHYIRILPTGAERQGRDLREVLLDLRWCAIFRAVTLIGAAEARACISASPRALLGQLAGVDLFLLTWVGNLFLVAPRAPGGPRTGGVPMRRVPERIASLIPLAVVLLLVAFFGVPVIFPWTYPEPRTIPSWSPKRRG